MTIVNLTLYIEEDNKNVIEAVKTVISNFKGISSFDLEKDDDKFMPKGKEEIEQEFREALKDIKSGKILEEAKDFDEIFSEI
jgi:hypothetical protein